MLLGSIRYASRSTRLLLVCAIIGSYRGAWGIRPHLIMSNLFLDKMSQLIDFINEAPGLVGSPIHSIGCRVWHRLVTKKVILLLDLWRCLMIGLLPVVFLAVMNLSVPT